MTNGIWIEMHLKYHGCRWGQLTDFVPDVFFARWQNQAINMSPLNTDVGALYTGYTVAKSKTLTEFPWGHCEIQKLQSGIFNK